MIFQEKILLPVSLLVIAVCLWELSMKMKIGWDEHEETNIYEIQWTADFVEPFLLLIAAILMVVRNGVDWGAVEWIVLPFELIVIYNQW